MAFSAHRHRFCGLCTAPSLILFLPEGLRLYDSVLFCSDFLCAISDIRRATYRLLWHCPVLVSSSHPGAEVLVSTQAAGGCVRSQGDPQSIWAQPYLGHRHPFHFCSLTHGCWLEVIPTPLCPVTPMLPVYLLPPNAAMTCIYDDLRASSLCIFIGAWWGLICCTCRLSCKRPVTVPSWEKLTWCSQADFPSPHLRCPPPGQSMVCPEMLLSINGPMLQGGYRLQELLWEGARQSLSKMAPREEGRLLRCRQHSAPIN